MYFFRAEAISFSSVYCHIFNRSGQKVGMMDMLVIDRPRLQVVILSEK
jgi:hypothetical protein